MAVFKIVVEGKDDIVFVSRLVESMRGSGPLRWKGVDKNNKVAVDGRLFGNGYVDDGRDVVAIEELRGVYIGERPNPSLKIVKTGNREMKVDHIVGIFDADDAKNFLGHDVEYGGLPARREYIEKKFSSLPASKRFFFMPDDRTNGTMEDLAMAIVKPEFKFIVEKSWPSYRESVRNALAKIGRNALNYSSKCTMSQFSAILDENVARDLYWIDSLFNDMLWDWNADALLPLKEFLRTAIPCLFGVGSKFNG